MIKKLIGLILALFIFNIGLFQVNGEKFEKIVINDDIQLIKLQDSIYVHVTWHKLDNFGRFPSNGLIIVKKGQALMIDTPMDNEKTERLVKYLKDSLSAKLTKLINGHFHDDCLGGLKYVKSLGVC